MKTFTELLTLQLNTVQPCVDSYVDFMGSDDRWDYLRGALALSSDMLEIQMDSEEEKALLDLLNLRVWSSYACDGVANEIWEWLDSMGITLDNDYGDTHDTYIYTELPKEV